VGQRKYDPAELVAAGYTGERGTFAATCRALGWHPNNALGCKQEADAILGRRAIPSAGGHTGQIESATGPAFSLPNFPASPAPVYEMPRLVTDKPLADIGDIHVPFHHKPFLDRAAARMHAEGVDTLVHGGDGIDAPQMHRRGQHSYHERRFTDDLDLATAMHEEWGRWVRSQWVLMGNHERFVRHRNGGHVDEAVLLAKWLSHLGESCRVIDGEALEIVHCGVKWVSVHGTSAAQNVALTMERYALRWRANIIMHHVHQTVLAERWGYTLVCVAGGADSDRLLYQHESPRPLSPTGNSFVILRRGEPTLYRARDPNW
jgi:predicted phosphodiesterase